MLTAEGVEMLYWTRMYRLLVYEVDRGGYLSPTFVLEKDGLPIRSAGTRIAADRMWKARSRTK